MDDYNSIRQNYRPRNIKVLLIAESPPPDANVASSRHFYRAEQIRKDDRLFVNTIKALYPEAAAQTEAQLEAKKQAWLQRFQHDGWFMVEALPNSLPHEITKPQRQELIRQNLPRILTLAGELCSPSTKIILIKSNVFDVAANPLRQAGFEVLNQQLLDYPGQFNQGAYRKKLAELASKARLL